MSGHLSLSFLKLSPKKDDKAEGISSNLYEQLNSELLLKLSSELRCAIWTDIFTDPVVTPWDHCFWKLWIETSIRSKKMKGQCPNCRRPLFKRELQTVTIFSKACETIRQLKAENNLFTQLAPVRKFEVRTREQIKDSIKKRSLAWIAETVEEEKCDSPKIIRKRKFDQISKECQDSFEKLSLNDLPVQIEGKRSESTSDSDHCEETKNDRSLNKFSNPFGNISKPKNYQTKRRKNISNSRKLLFVKNPRASRKRTKRLRQGKKSQSKTKVSQNQEQSPNLAQNMILSNSGLTEVEKDIFEWFWAQFDIEVTDEVEEDYTTHLIMKSTTTRRKYCQAVIYGIPVIDYKWIQDSMKNQNNGKSYLFDINRIATCWEICITKSNRRAKEDF